MSAGSGGQTKLPVTMFWMAILIVNYVYPFSSAPTSETRSGREKREEGKRTHVLVGRDGLAVGGELELAGGHLARRDDDSHRGRVARARLGLEAASRSSQRRKAGRKGSAVGAGPSTRGIAVRSWGDVPVRQREIVLSRTEIWRSGRGRVKHELGKRSPEERLTDKVVRSAESSRSVSSGR